MLATTWQANSNVALKHYKTSRQPRQVTAVSCLRPRQHVCAGADGSISIARWPAARSTGRGRVQRHAAQCCSWVCDKFRVPSCSQAAASSEACVHVTVCRSPNAAIYAVVQRIAVGALALYTCTEEDGRKAWLESRGNLRYT